MSRSRTFLAKLRQTVTRVNPSTATWTADGTALLIFDEQNFRANLWCQWSSFVGRLRILGFQRVTVTEPVACFGFAHRAFNAFDSSLDDALYCVAASDSGAVSPAVDDAGRLGLGSKRTFSDMADTDVPSSSTSAEVFGDAVSYASRADTASAVAEAATGQVVLQPSRIGAGMSTEQRLVQCETLIEYLWHTLIEERERHAETCQRASINSKALMKVAHAVKGLIRATSLAPPPLKADDEAVARRPAKRQKVAPAVPAPPQSVLFPFDGANVTLAHVNAPIGYNGRDGRDGLDTNGENASGGACAMNDFCMLTERWT